MARPTVRIHPPNPGDEDWLASMIAPLLDIDSAKLSRALSKGAISVGEGLDAAEADELVDVLTGFGARAERLGGQRVSRPVPAPRGSATEPFDAAHLRQVLGGEPPKRQPSMKSSGSMRRVRPRASKQPDPARRDRISGGIPRRTTGRISGAVPARDARPPQATRSSDRIPRRVTAPTRQSGPMPVRRTGPATRKSGPVPARQTGPSESGPAARSSGAVPTRSSGPVPKRSSGAVPKRSSDALPRTTQPGEDSRLAPELVSASTGPAQKEPPWFPQVPIRPGEAINEQESGHSWWWIVLIMAVAGAAAWWMQTQ